MFYHVATRITKEDWNTLSMADKKEYHAGYISQMTRHQNKLERLQGKIMELQTDVMDVQDTMQWARDNYIEATGVKLNG